MFRIKKNFCLMWVIVLLALICLISGYYLFCKNSGNETTDLIQNKGTHLVLHLSTHTYPYGIQPAPCSYFLFYDKEGNVIKRHMVNEEVIGDFAIQSEGAEFYFFKNQTVITTPDSQNTMLPSSNITISATNFGPSQIGYIDEMEMAYALLNVGTKDGQYINVLRFTSLKKSYDVVLPYYLEHICYDQIEKRFYCIISPVNTGYGSGTVLYATVSYNKETDAFCLDNKIQRIDDFTYDLSSTLYRYSMVKGNKLYMVVLVASDKENAGDLLLNVYDVNSNELVSREYLLKKYDLGKLGHGLMSGSSAFPACVRNGKLYLFTANQQFFVIENENNISVEDMPFSFENAYSIYTPNEAPEKKRDDFFGSGVTVQDDGTIYILNLYEENGVSIFRWNNGEYETVYEFQLPNDLPKGVLVNSFYFVD